MWLSGERQSIGPQKGPACSRRLRAQWRQVDRENREAIEVRRQWMIMLGHSDSEIQTVCESAFDLSLVEELEQLLAAIALSKTV